MTFLLLLKNVVDEVQRRDNLNQIRSLCRKMTIIDDEHVGMLTG